MKRPIIVFAVLVVVIAATLACSIGSEDSTEVVSSTIEATTGGIIHSLDGHLSLEIPPGALSDDTEISIRAVPQENLPDELTE